MTKKTFIITLIIIVTAILSAYGLYLLYWYIHTLYEIVIADVQERLTDAIAEGIRKGIGSAINPLNWPKALLQR